MATTSTTRRRFLAGAAAAALSGGLLPAHDPAVARLQPSDPAGAAAPPPKATDVRVPAGLQLQRLSPELAVVSGGGGNIAIHVRDECVLVVDAGIPARARDVTALIAQLAPDLASVQKILVNTHYHFDHVGANGLMARAGFTIVASAACRQRNTQRLVFDSLSVTLEPLESRALQTLLVPAGGLELAVPDRVRLLPIPPAHTDGDVAVLFDALNVLHTGDLLFNGMFPVIDPGVGGSLEGMIAALGRLLELTNPQTRVIPGHGPVGTPADLRRAMEMLEQVRERLTPFAQRGATPAEVIAARPLADLEPTWGRGVVNAEVFLRMAYRPR